MALHDTRRGNPGNESHYLYRLVKKSTMDQGLRDEEAENEETKLVASQTLNHA